MKVFILIRKKNIQVPSILHGGQLKMVEIIDDIHNVCFKSLKVAQAYVAKMKPEDKMGVFFVQLKLDKTEEVKLLTPQEVLDAPESKDEANPST